MLNLQVAIGALIAFSIGFGEWWLAVKRTIAILPKTRKLSTVAWTTFTEVFVACTLSLIAITQFSVIEALVLFAFYAFGGSLGAITPLYRSGTQ